MHRPQMTFHPSPVAPVAPQLQPRISTSLTDVTERVTRQEMKIEYGEGHRRLLLLIRKDPPHAAFDDRCDTTVQARIAIEQPP